MPPRQDKTRAELERLKLMELQELSEKNLVESSDTGATMIERLMACSQSESMAPSGKGKEPATPESLDDTCGAIEVTTSGIRDQTSMIEEAHKALEDVPEEEELDVEYDPLTAGNRGGISWAAFPRRLEMFEAKLASIQMELDSTKMVVDEHGKRLSSLDTRIGDLSISADAYKNIRHNFIDMYVRSTTSGMATRTRKQTQEGKGAVHGGDAHVDANLYRDGQERNDFQYLKSSHMETINVLNIHAGIKADQGESMNPRFYGLFDDFINAWENFGYAINYLEESAKDSHAAAVNKAYWALHEFLENEEWRKGEEAPKRGRAAGEGRA
ncbi:hypothetical protein B9Z19DRAFT_1194630 [Tuber borchii]|uniref:Uncharacterized protein n=1 Tax=Tuber borchii TaxID=42251 RepID=A0A2T6ZM56_TUBBO|nr:hypothetical protein B9Z19DRAFT_1194630 [Tuber borchii]